MTVTTQSAKSITKYMLWKKSLEAVFKQSPENWVFATGHNSFFKSPDGKQDWILYHANNQPGEGCGNKRSPRAQPFTWRKDGSPDFGITVKTGVPMAVPSGTNRIIYITL
jgi:GH43 family beta-xylosidase